MATDVRNNRVYGLNQALLGIPADRIISRRNPTTRDKAELGQMWVNRTTGIAFFLTAIAANVYTWCATAATAAAYTAAGLVTAGTGLVATTGAGTPSGAGLHIAADGADITGLVAVTGSATFSGAILAGTTITSTAGAITSGAGLIATTSILAGTTITSTLGNITATHGDVVFGTDTHGLAFLNTGRLYGTGTELQYLAPANGGFLVNLGDDIGGTVFQVRNFSTAPKFEVDSEGNAILVGELKINTATMGITLPGPVRIMSGAGDPAAGLAVNIGDMYIRTDAVSAVTRVFLASAANTWVNLTCSA